MRRFASAVGATVASPMVEAMDVNAILQEIDVNELLAQIDVNAVLDRLDVNMVFDRIDANRIFDRLDFDRHLSRIDLDRQLARVDLNALIAASNLEEVIARSTSGVFAGISHLVRTRLAWLDQLIQRLGQWGCWQWCNLGCRQRRRPQQTRPPRRSRSSSGGSGGHCCCYVRQDVLYYLPPRPGRHPQDSYTEWHQPWTLHQREFSKALQFRTCGMFARILCQGFDQFFVWVSYAGMAAVIKMVGEALTNNSQWYAELLSALPSYFNILVYVVYNFIYYVVLVGCTGRSLGMRLLGLLLVSKMGNRVSFLKVCGQFFLHPLNYLCFGWVVGFLRRDGKMWSDLIGGVAIVYAYDSTHIVDTKNNAEMAMSLTDFAEILQDEQDVEDSHRTVSPAYTTGNNNNTTNHNTTNKTKDDDDVNGLDVDPGDIECSGINRT